MIGILIREAFSFLGGGDTVKNGPLGAEGLGRRTIPHPRAKVCILSPCGLTNKGLKYICWKFAVEPMQAQVWDCVGLEWPDWSTVEHSGIF